MTVTRAGGGGGRMGGSEARRDMELTRMVTQHDCMSWESADGEKSPDVTSSALVMLTACSSSITLRNAVASALSGTTPRTCVS